ncbi:MAG: hypothetical protein K9L98_02765 [Candidatus Pacebacteria bacterium]|nr:hypothetical protein [Candidatus Paceibacterota bacterium]MCF7862907.1 hypothetical protein [Candidatus Paceibacterota bacterium]
MSPETKNCQNCKNDFIIESEDFLFYQKIKVPPPTFCPECRFFRRLIWRNERRLYHRNCALCSKKTISVYSPESIFNVYCVDCWKKDEWDPQTYALDVDFNKDFFTQFNELFKNVPRPAVGQNGKNINSEYANMIQDVKNVYLSYSVIWDSENIFYSNNISKSKDIYDTYLAQDSNIIYECIDSTKNYDCAFCDFSSNCVSSRFLINCRNCQDCIGCVNLRNKRFCILNEQYSKEEYEKKLKDLNLGNYETLVNFQKEFYKFNLKLPRQYGHILNSINSTGDNIFSSKNAKYCFSCAGVENVKYGFRCPGGLKDAMDVTHKGRGELIYEHATGGSDLGNNLFFTIYGMPALINSEYTDYCGSSADLFGCVGLKNKQYCILNKQYSKEKYFEMIEKIKKHMNDMPYVGKVGHIYKYGEFFPPEFSPFSYTESVLFDLMPKDKEFLTKFGIDYGEVEVKRYMPTIKAEELPIDIKDTKEDITEHIIQCSVSGKSYRILQSEFEFYKRMDLPLPRLHQDERYKKRLERLNPMKLWHRSCMCDKDKHGHAGKCTEEFETSYAPDRPEIVYCEGCYNKEVY